MVLFLMNVPVQVLGFLYGFFCQNLKLGAEKGVRYYLMIFYVFHVVAMFATFYVLFTAKIPNITTLIVLVFISNLSIGALQVLISSQIVEHSRHQHIETDQEEFSRFNHA